MASCITCWLNLKVWLCVAWLLFSLVLIWNTPLPFLPCNRQGTNATQVIIVKEPTMSNTCLLYPGTVACLYNPVYTKIKVANITQNWLTLKHVTIIDKLLNRKNTCQELQPRPLQRSWAYVSKHLLLIVHTIPYHTSENETLPSYTQFLLLTCLDDIDHINTMSVSCQNP